MKKKLISMLAIAIMVLAMGITVYGDEYQYNQEVLWLYINGINYNSTDETERVEGVTYDYVSNTVTIENCNLTVDNNFISYSGNIPLNIVIKGNNTITSTEYEDTYVDDFIFASGLFCEGGADTSIYITGDGTLNLNKFSNFVNRGVLEEDAKGILSIEGVTINTDGACIDTPYGDVSIKNSNIKIDNSLGETSSGAITIGAIVDPSCGMYDDDLDGNGTITIQNSVVELKGKEYAQLIRCKVLNTLGENIYAGKTRAEYSYTTKELLSDYYLECYYSSEDLNYILITTKKLNYPSVSTKNNSTNNNSSNITKPTTTTVTKPGKAKISSVKNVKGKKVKLTWKKMSGVNGYQIVYGLNKKCTKGKKTVTASASSKSKTIKKLKKKKTYYFKIRAYKTSNGSKAYGSWSAVKKVKIKK